MLQVRFRHAGDQAHLGDGDAGERGDLAGRGHPQFHHADSAVVGVLQQRERQAPLVVPVAAGAEDPVLRAEGRRRRFLGGGLADAAGDGADGGAAPDPHLPGEGAEGDGGVPDFEEERGAAPSAVGGFRRGRRFGGRVAAGEAGVPGDDRPGGAPGEGVGDEGVAVVVRAPDGEEEVAWADPPAVEGDAGDDRAVEDAEGRAAGAGDRMEEAVHGQPGGGGEQVHRARAVPAVVGPAAGAGSAAPQGAETGNDAVGRCGPT